MMKTLLARKQADARIHFQAIWENQYTNQTTICNCSLYKHNRKSPGLPPFSIL